MIAPAKGAIGFDGKKAFNNMTGIGNYSRFIINTLSARNPDIQFHLFTPKCKNEEAKRNLEQRNNLIVHLPTKARIKEWWRCFGIVKDLKESGIQLYHGLSNELPFGIQKAGIPSVVTVHDLIFLRYPQTFGWADRTILKIKVRYACEHADHIIAISEQTKKDIIRYYGIDARKIEVLYQGCAERFYHPCTEEEIHKVSQRYQLPSKYMISVGTIEERKNHHTILEAVNQLPEVQWIIISKKTPLQHILEQEIHKRNLTDRVRIINGVSNEDLPALYQGARASVYLSFFEGFGIPVLEGLASGIPVITATGSCLEEAGGDACLYCDPFDKEKLTGLIHQLWHDDALHQHLTEKGKIQAARFCKEAIAEKMEAFYRKILQEYANR